MTLSAESSRESRHGQFSHLRTANSSFRLNQIEKIRANGIGDLIALPQLVVCGDQSAGKSSVLEGITGIPFPRQEGLCTRFPTEIILRHTESAKTSIEASIRPEISRHEDVRTLLTSFRKDVQDMGELPLIIQEVSKLMRIRGYSGDDEGNAFAADSLRVEISGPIGLHLSIVDLPGLISVSNEEQSDEDVKAVHDMVAAYLESSRTIILAVLQAGNDIANQPIIKLARKYDKDGERTVGIITKPDLINEGAEAKIALISKNQDSIKFKLGFFLLKNPSPSEVREGFSMDMRSEREMRFFSSPAWANQNLDMNRVGVERLRLFLQQLLDSHIERELPKVRDEIKKMLTAKEAELRILGEARTSTVHVRSFLTNLSMRFYQLLQAALDGNYLSFDPEFFMKEGTRLRAGVQRMNTGFAETMRVSGQRRKLKIDEARDIENESRLADITSEDEISQLLVTRARMKHWVKQTYLKSRGKELPGTPNFALVAELFREQSRLWPIIAAAHVRDVLHKVTDWIHQAMKRVVQEDHVRGRLNILLRSWIDKAERLAFQELEKLNEDERSGPITYNHYYTDNVQKSRLDAQKDALMKAVNSAMTPEKQKHGKQPAATFQAEVDRIVSAISSTVGGHITTDMDEQACNEALTELDAYYKVAMKMFVDNVARQVIERHIISTLPHAFDPNVVAKLSDDELLRIGSEPQAQARRREKLKNWTQGLSKSLVDLQNPMHDGEL